MQINQGTSAWIASDEVGSVQYQVVKLDVGANGLSSAFTGTVAAITSVANVVSGTLASITNVANGTINALPLLQPNKWQAVVNTGTSTMGTVKAAVAGSVIYLTDLVVSVAGTATNVEFGDGGTANLVMGTLYFAANGGMVANFTNPIYTTSGSALVYKQSANVPLSITAGGFVK